MTEPLTTDEQALLAKTISEALGGRLSINFMEVPKLLAAAKKGGTSREHVVQGLSNWLRTDPQAQELIMRAVASSASIGSKTFNKAPATTSNEPDAG